MKDKFVNYIMLSVFVTVLFAGGCGGGGGKDSPGVKASATITPTYNGKNTLSVDAVQDRCSNGSTTQAEYFADHSATASISASLINTSSVEKELTIYIDRYTIDYRSHVDSPGAPSLQQDMREKTFSFIVNGTTASVDMPVAFVDLLRKDQYLSAVAGQLLNNYTATYTFEGHSENGIHFTFSGQTDFQIGDFNNCPTGFNPL